MAITDTRPETGTDLAVAPSMVPAPVSILGSGDHTSIGLVYIIASVLFGVAAWIAISLTHIHSVSATFLSDSTTAILASSSRVGIVLLAIVPLFLGIGTYVVPLQVGARTIAFPRAAAAALWAWLLTSGIFIVANAIRISNPGEKADSLEVLAALGIIASLLLGTVCLLTTIVALRSPDMSIDRVPMTSFAMLVGGAVWILTLPVIAALVLLSWIDFRYGNGTLAGPDIASVRLADLLGQPQIYAFAVPGLGIVADVVATLTGSRLAQRGLLLTGIGAFGVLSIGVWAIPALYPEASEQIPWQAMGLLQVLPVLLLLAGLGAALKAGRPRPLGALGLALVSMLLLLLAVVAGALIVVTPLQLRATGAFSTGQAVLVLAAAFAAAIAGLAYWGPKMTGRMPADGIAKLGALVVLGGGALGGLPMCVVGFSTKFTGLSGSTDALRWISVVGTLLLALALLLSLAGLLSGVRRGAPAADADAWGTGQTLEWDYPSPPVVGAAVDLPFVRSAEPLLDQEA